MLLTKKFKKLPGLSGPGLSGPGLSGPSHDFDKKIIKIMILLKAEPHSMLFFTQVDIHHRKTTIKLMLLTKKFKKLIVLLKPEPQSMHFLHSSPHPPSSKHHKVDDFDKNHEISHHKVDDFDKKVQKLMILKNKKWREDYKKINNKQHSKNTVSWHQAFPFRELSLLLSFRHQLASGISISVEKLVASVFSVPFLGFSVLFCFFCAFLCFFCAFSVLFLCFFCAFRHGYRAGCSFIRAGWSFITN